MKTPRRRLPGELVFAVVLVCFSGFMLWQAYGISGFESITSAGFFPMLTTGVMVVTGLLIVRSTARSEPVAREGGESLAQQFRRRLAPNVLVGFTVAIVLYMLALQPVGFLVASYVFLVASMRLLGSRRWLLNLVIAAVALAAVYVIFQTVFSVVLPSGSLLRGLWT